MTTQTQYRVALGALPVCPVVSHQKMTTPTVDSPQGELTDSVVLLVMMNTLSQQDVQQE